MTRIGFVGLFVAAALSAHCAPSPETAPPEAERVAVSTSRAEFTDLPSTFEAGGVVRAGATAVIASRIMAPVSRVHVRSGDRVRRGAPLVTLDGREMSANSARAEASFASAAEMVRAAESDVRATTAAVRLARATHDRISSLHARKSATPQELDQAVQAMATAEAQVGAAEARAAAAVAARDAARASSEAARVGSSYTRLVAPFDGVVTERMVDPGSMVSPGSPLLTLEDPRLFRLELQLDERRAAQLAVGQHVDVRIDTAAIGGTTWTPARVSEIARVAAASHSFLVKVDLADRRDLRSGLFGRARFAGSPQRTLTVPASAILRRGQLTFVFIVEQGGLARLRPITTGATSADRVQALAGLREGDVVVSAPPPSLVDGARVAPESAAAHTGDSR